MIWLRMVVFIIVIDRVDELIIVNQIDLFNCVSSLIDNIKMR